MKDGREFYAESSEVDWTKASQWTLQTVRPQLHGTGMEREEIGYAVRRFIEGDEHLVFWGYFPAYDWVAFCWLFGDMNELPFRFPQLCLDIKQWAIELGNPDLPLQSSARHHALNDARWTRGAWAFLANLNPAAGERRSMGLVLDGVEFRKKAITSRREEAQVEAKVVHLLERYLLVEQLLDLRSVQWDRRREAPYPVQTVPEADRAARSIRQAWGLGIDPIPNLMELLEERGIKVLSTDLDNIDGMTARVGQAGKEALPVILVMRATGASGSASPSRTSSAIWCLMSPLASTKRRLRIDLPVPSSCPPKPFGPRSATPHVDQPRGIAAPQGAVRGELSGHHLSLPRPRDLSGDVIPESVQGLFRTRPAGLRRSRSQVPSLPNGPVGLSAFCALRPLRLRCPAFDRATRAHHDIPASEQERARGAAHRRSTASIGSPRRA